MGIEVMPVQADQAEEQEVVEESAPPSQEPEVEETPVVEETPLVEETPVVEDAPVVIVEEAARPEVLLVFLTSEKEEKRITFTERPIGLSYRMMNRKVCEVKGAQAKEHGVQIGWKVIKVDDDDLTCMSWGKFLECIQSHTEKLPVAESNEQ